MIEMLGVLAIIGVLSVGGIAGYSKAMTKYRINKTIEQITLIAGNVRTFFAPQKSYEGLMKKTTAAGGSITVYMSDATVARKAKLVPEDMWEYNNDGTFKQFTGAFGGRVSLSATKKSLTDDNKAFSISYYIGDSAEACIEILSHDWATANVTAVSISGGNGHGGTQQVFLCNRRIRRRLWTTTAIF